MYCQCTFFDWDVLIRFGFRENAFAQLYKIYLVQLLLQKTYRLFTNRQINFLRFFDLKLVRFYFKRNLKKNTYWNNLLRIKSSI